MCGAISPLPNTPSGRGSQLKAQGQLYLFFTTCTLSVSVRYVSGQYSVFISIVLFPGDKQTLLRVYIKQRPF
jgi:hypothetical protein